MKKGQNSLVEFSLAELTDNEKQFIASRELLDLGCWPQDHFGICLRLRNIIRTWSNEIVMLSASDIDLDFPTRRLLFSDGEMGENHLLEKLWRVLNEISLDKNQINELKNLHESIMSFGHPEIDENENYKEIITFLEKLKKHNH